MRIPNPIPADGIDIPVLATFTGIKKVPWWAISHNSASPLLRLFEDRIMFKVLKIQQKPYDSIESIDISQSRGTANIVITWSNTLFTFSGNVYDTALLAELVRFFERKKLPITQKARNLAQKK